MGPSAVRYAGLIARLRKLGHKVEDLGNVQVTVHDCLSPEGGLAYLPAVLETCESVYQLGMEAAADGCIPLFLGGDHSIAMGTVGGVTHDSASGLLWIDAHGDFNTMEFKYENNKKKLDRTVKRGHCSFTAVRAAQAGL